MEENNCKNKNKQKTLKDKIILAIIIVVGIGFICVSLYIGYNVFIVVRAICHFLDKIPGAMEGFEDLLNVGK